MISRRAPWRLVLALALLPALLASPAIAEPSREDRAAALALFDEGRKLLAEKKFAEACPKLEASMRLDPGIGTLFNLSDCYEQIGRIASAWSGFRDVAAQARATSQDVREKLARERAAALESKLSRVRIVVPAELASSALTITRDGVPLPSSLVGTPIPMDPGTHTLRITAEGKEPWETKITLRPDGKTVDVQVPALAPAAPGATTAPTATAPASTTSEPAGSPSGAPTASGAPTTTASGAPSGAPDSTSPRPWQKPVGIVAAVAGVLGVGAGIAVGFVANDTNIKSNDGDCTEGTNFCRTQAGVDLRTQAVLEANISTGLVVAGAVIGAAGIVLWITAPSAPAAAAGPAKGAATGPRAVPRSLPRTTVLTSPPEGPAITDVQVGVTPGGLVVRGRF